MLSNYIVALSLFGHDSSNATLLKRMMGSVCCRAGKFAGPCHDAPSVCSHQEGGVMAPNTQEQPPNAGLPPSQAVLLGMQLGALDRVVWESWLLVSCL
jgi:hypothetical protein